MVQTSMSLFAEKAEFSIRALRDLLAKAGVVKSLQDDTLTDSDKVRLLEYLHNTQLEEPCVDDQRRIAFAIVEESNNGAIESPLCAIEAIQEPEGVDESSSDGWGDYPLDAVFVRTENRSVYEVVKRIANQRYVLDPDFQRDFVWPNQKQSKLIESCVMRIPLPVFYVAEAMDGRIIVVDGLQRLTTFARFIGNQLRLTGLDTGEKLGASHALEGKLYKDLPLHLQERVQDTQLTMYILDAKAPERARLDIFERVNSGEPLTRQQMRNALYSGPATFWLKQAAESDAFRSATGKSLNPKTMRDREAINRFCAFKLIGWRNYTTGDMDGFLAEGLKRLGQLSHQARSELMQSFEQVMRLNRLFFGEHAFRKSLASEYIHPARTVINISLFEVCAVTMSEEFVLKIGEEDGKVVRAAIVALVRDDGFLKSITYSTNSTASVQARFGAMELALCEATLL
ncbi:DUF262 domain-containing protein [uncultured Propionivibrio sp.]|uniref:DUF262 domain-containing protein n=1 Tax=uncultured Propionivibrio sp. TaxID=426737 RepID=UPI0029C0D297|nr:DUF262 domain-containing protein [uncultured Propionivibrio sp.]